MFIFYSKKYFVRGSGRSSLSFTDRLPSGLGTKPHALHNHTNCTTVDINQSVYPSICLDFATKYFNDVLTKLGRQQFTLIVLEALPYWLYIDEDFVHLLENCNSILTETGKILIPMVREDQVNRIITGFTQYGFRNTLKGIDFYQIYPLISKFTDHGTYADLYITRYNTHFRNSKRHSELNLYFLIFKW